MRPIQTELAKRGIREISWFIEEKLLSGARMIAVAPRVPDTAEVTDELIKRGGGRVVAVILW
jgi:anaerobic selenocysteine-containing dehydrogenase